LAKKPVGLAKKPVGLAKKPVGLAKKPVGFGKTVRRLGRDAIPTAERFLTLPTCLKAITTCAF
jgi:hypothetical protein